jgi:outer membrane lipoprotein-sorting protein
MRSARAHECALILLLVSASASCRVSNELATNSNAAPETVVSTTPPFQTREPDRYQATRTITIVTSKGETVVTRTLIARDGPLRREETETVVYLELAEGRFVVLPDQQVYAAVTAEDPIPTADEDDESSPDRLLHTDPISATYQPLGTEVIGGRNAKKYRIVVNNPAAENVSQNETLMWIDETLAMPVKSETKSADGARTAMELSDIVLAPEKQLFQIPANYEKISLRDLWKQRKGARLNP